MGIAPSVFSVPTKRDVIFMGSGTVILNKACSLYRNYVYFVNRNIAFSKFQYGAVGRILSGTVGGCMNGSVSFLSFRKDFSGFSVDN